jgi:hypothetical protein
MKWSSAMVLAIGLIVGFSFGLMLTPLIPTRMISMSPYGSKSCIGFVPASAAWARLSP